MKRHTGLRMLLAAFAVSIIFVAGSVPHAYGTNFEPPPPGSRLQGPAMLAKVTLDGITIALSNVVCKGKAQDAPPPQTYSYSLSEITSAIDLIGYHIPGAADVFPQCFDFTGGGLIVQSAYNLTEIQTTTGPILQVDVVVLGVVAK